MVGNKSNKKGIDNLGLCAFRGYKPYCLMAIKGMNVYSSKMRMASGRL